MDANLDAAEVHHEDCYVRSMAHVLEEPECNCVVKLYREALDRIATFEARLEERCRMGGGGFTIICNACGNERPQVWDFGRGGEYLGKKIKCPDCGEVQEIG